ncbi:MAG: hypothetical protein ACKV19_26905 [Verrucomicrobiales bacterium]
MKQTQKSNMISLVVGLAVGLLVGAGGGYLATRKHWDARWQAAGDHAASAQNQVQLGIAVSMAEQLLKEETAPQEGARRLAGRYLQAMRDHSAAYPSVWLLTKPSDYARVQGLIEKLAARDAGKAPTASQPPADGAADRGAAQN